MAFSEEVVKQAWERSGGLCECNRRTHSHFYAPCNKSLTWESRGRGTRGGWEAHHTSYGQEYGLADCQILCWACHEASSW